MKKIIFLVVAFFLATANLRAKPTDALPTIVSYLLSGDTISLVADAGADQNVNGGDIVTLDGSGSTISSGSIVKYEWFNSASNIIGIGKIINTNLSQGTHNITLEITSDNGLTNTDKLVVVVAPLIPPSIKIPVLKTGQTTCYNFTTGIKEICHEKTHKGQDGYCQKGKARSYSRSGNIVTDNATNLQWQDDKAAKTTQRNWEGAKTYCENLTIGGYIDWRLPSIQELLSIVDSSRYKGDSQNSLGAIDPTFKNVFSDYYYLTSTTNAYDEFDAWDVTFSFGYGGFSNKSDNGYVRCVRTRQ